MSGKNQNCCGACADQGFCRVGLANCCVECHMAWEEEHVAQYLPAPLFAQLQKQHDELMRSKLPAAALARHSQWEEKIFNQYCPREVCDQILVDHEEWEAGRLPSREARALKNKVLR